MSHAPDQQPNPYHAPTNQGRPAAHSHGPGQGDATGGVIPYKNPKAVDRLLRWDPGHFDFPARHRLDHPWDSGASGPQAESSHQGFRARMDWNRRRRIWIVVGHSRGHRDHCVDRVQFIGAAQSIAKPKRWSAQPRELGHRLSKSFRMLPPIR